MSSGKNEIKPITLREMCEVLSTYSLNHQDLSIFGLAGVCQSVYRKILIDTNLSSPERIQTILHEIRHGYNHLNRLKDKEREVEEAAQLTYRKYWR